MGNKEAIVINIMGGPGTGKTIITKDLYAALKRAGISCEESPEYIKGKLRQKAIKAVEHQIYIFAKQEFQLFTLKDEVDVIITDAPLINSIIYDKDKCPHLKALILKEFAKYKNFIYVIERDHRYPYETEGRYQDLDGAKKIDIEVIDMLKSNHLNYKVLEGVGNNSLNTILEDVFRELKINQK